MPTGAGRPDLDADTPSQSNRARGASERLPAGAFVLLVALAVVFGYGIYLKATAPSSPPPVIEAPGPVAGYGSAGRVTTASPAQSTPSTGVSRGPNPLTRGGANRQDEPTVDGARGSNASTPGGAYQPEPRIAGGGREAPLDFKQTPLIPETGPASPARSVLPPPAPPSGTDGSGAVLSAGSKTPRAAGPKRPAASELYPSETSAPAPVAGAAPIVAKRPAGGKTRGSTSPSAAGDATGTAASAAASTSPDAVAANTPRPITPRTTTSAPPAPTSPDAVAGTTPRPIAPRTTTSTSSESARSTPPAPDSPAPIPSPQAPRGGVPSAAERKARELFKAERYVEAARSWKEWARTVPAGAWTIQIAALHIDRPQAKQALAAISEREGLFLLPPGSLPGNLSPVCVGIYPSADQAKQAASTTGPFPRSTSRPFAKPLESLTGG